MNSLFLVLLAVFPQTWFSPEVLSGNTLSTFKNPLSLFYNPALLPEKFSFFATYSNPFRIRELMTVKFALGERGVAFGSSFLRSSGYIEGSLVFGFRKSIGMGHLGFALRGLFLEVEGFPIEKDLSLDLGFYVPYERFAIGGFLRDINTPRLANSPVPPSVDIAARDFLLKGVDFFVDLFHQSFHPLSVRVGQRWRIHPLLTVFAGASSYPPMVSFGFTLGKTPSFSFSLKEHPELGETRSISVLW